MKYLKSVVIFICSFVISMSLTVLFAKTALGDGKQYDSAVVGIVLIGLSLFYLAAAEWVIHRICDIVDYIKHPRLELVIVEFDTNAKAEKEE